MSRLNKMFSKAKEGWQKAKEETDKKEQQRKERKSIKNKEKNASYLIWFGGKPSFSEKLTYSTHKASFKYGEQYVLNDENPLYVVDCKYKNKKSTGILIALEDHLYFIHGAGEAQNVECFTYDKVSNFKFQTKKNSKIEVVIKYKGRNHTFENLMAGKETDKMINILRSKLGNTVPSNPQTTSQSNDKYNQLEKLGDLKEKGILSEEEFNKEKEKLLK
ncbi:SHOCT domain-containing protein [Halalkalibacillus sediminis]|nr:SHOCT domain-containing protein [Halalkalibacillus sediminis]